MKSSFHSYGKAEPESPPASGKGFRPEVALPQRGRVADPA